MRAEPGDSMREIHFEETTWKARPDWSPDGKRVVYSSYVGTQYNQLWLMTSDGGVPFELTYGAFDATSPRWSRDATHIAYVCGPQMELAVSTDSGGSSTRRKPHLVGGGLGLMVRGATTTFRGK